MTQEEKLKQLEKWLDANGKLWFEPLKYNDNNLTSWYDRGVRIVLPQELIAVAVVKSDKENSLYELIKQQGVKAFFIREDETMDFIIEKMQNCLKGWSVKRARKEIYIAENIKPYQPRKRARKHITRKPVYEKVTSNHTKQ